MILQVGTDPEAAHEGLLKVRRMIHLMRYANYSFTLDKLSALT